MKFRLTRQAAADLETIYRSGALQFGSRQADTYLALLENAFRFLAENPLAARRRSELSPDIRIHSVQSHLIIYRVEGDGSILVIRVRHGHEDYADE
ncbi:MAG: type II toxin-antitoxin system RelE/ParE family toxin [Wenzhouxiangella sp.]